MRVSHIDNDPGAYEVVSASGQKHIVRYWGSTDGGSNDAAAWDCDCPEARQGAMRICRHIEAVIAWLNEPPDEQ